MDMQRRIMLSLLFFAAFGLLFAGASAAADYAPGQAMVLIKSGIGKVSAASLAAPQGQNYVNTVASSVGARVATTYNALSEARGDIFALVVSDTQTTDELIAALLLKPEVIAASPNYIVRAHLVPNDTDYGRLWGMKKIRAEEAWDMTSGDSNIHIAVADSGIDKTHEDLAENLDMINSRNFTNSTSIPVENASFDDGDGHGTHVSGTIAAIGNNGKGVVGVNWNAKIIVLRVLDDNGKGYVSWTTAALNYLAGFLQANPSLHVPAVNLSLGGYRAQDPVAMQSDVDWLAYKALSDLDRTVIVVAAGNEGLEIGQPAPYSDPGGIFWEGEYAYPASYIGIDNMVVVGATDESDAASDFSNWSATQVHLAAPGNGILSTLPASEGSYGFMEGTSMAAPHVAGAVGLLAAKNPTWSAAQLKYVLLKNADTTINPIPETSWNDQNQPLSRRGLLNIQAALKDTTIGVPVTSITLAPTSATLAIGEPKQFLATVLPADATEKKVSWRSSNTFIATVDSNGLVIGRAPGRAVITVQAQDTGEASITAAITVTATVSIPVTDITLDPQSARVSAGTSFRVNATVVPANATDKSLVWSSSNTTVAVVDSTGLVTTRQAGSAYIAAHAVGGVEVAKMLQLVVTGGSIQTDSGSSGGGCSAGLGAAGLLLLGLLTLRRKGR